ncbi:MAG: ImmA/IrrE family metallo-endopeptidase [Candidatus Thermoplasmatota archaeon]|nr:ImmA/IrrE family metallo-endopeptidase [Candidatus Thermoplasmatota archaeon]
MPSSITTQINPDVFKWLRESSGWTIEDVAKRLKTSEDVVNSIESGKKDPTLRQLKELSNAYKRPLAAFFLSYPKPEKPRPKDYRMLPQKKDVFDKKTILILRKARMLQEISGELSKNIYYETKPSIKKANITDDPKSLADKYRVELGFTTKKQTELKTSYEMFNFLRDKMEDLNILVFQDSIPVEDARGFALPDETPNVIVLSSKDSIEARIFSLMHEFAHIILGEPAIDFPDYTNPYQNKIEYWCNQFSSSFLLSEVMARSIFEANQENLTDTKTLNKISRRYKVSKGMLLFNMLKYDFITESEFKNVLERYIPQEPEEADEEEKDGEKKQSGGIPADVKCLSMVGNKFVSLVANNYDHNHITYTDALNYLSIKSKIFDKVLAKASK